MMKELDPDRPSTAKGANQGYYRKLFEQLDRLSKLQLAVFPNSPVQDSESAVDTRYEKLRTVFRHLSHGVGLVRPEAIFHKQLLRAYRGWLVGEAPVPLDRDAVFTGERNGWNDRLRVELNYTLPGYAEALRNISATRTQHIQQVCHHWQQASDFDFDLVFAGELREVVLGPWRQFMDYQQRLFAAENVGGAVDISTLYPPEASSLISHMLGDLPRTASQPDTRLQRIQEFFHSDAARSVPYARVCALFWAAFARDVRQGRKPENFPGASVFNDVDLIAAYGPFCDAMFMDKQISHLASQGGLREQLQGISLYSFRDNEHHAFVEYLECIEREASPEHLRLVKEVYGSDWPKPYIELLEHHR